MRAVLSAALIVCLAMLSSAQAGDGAVMSHAGLGPVRLGMTAKAAEAALGTRLDAPDLFEDCSQANRGDGRDPDVSYMIEGGRITRIDAFGEAKDIRTDKGLSLGATAAEVRKAYGKGVRERPGFYDDRRRHLSVQAPDRRGMLDFEIDETGRVATMSTGLYPSIQYVEGCA